MLNVAPQKERIPDHLRAMAEQDDKSAASGKTGGKSTIGVGCAPRKWLVPEIPSRSGVKPPVWSPALGQDFCFYTYAKPWWPPLMAAHRQLLMDRCTL